MNIALVSKMFGVPTDTLRYYERVGLMPPVTRDEKGYRDYTDYDLKWVYFAKVMRNAGVSVEALIDYVALFRQGREETATARQEILIEQKHQLEEKIKEMNETLEYLTHKIEDENRHLENFEKLLDEKNKSSEDDVK